MFIVNTASDPRNAASDPRLRRLMEARRADREDNDDNDADRGRLERRRRIHEPEVLESEEESALEDDVDDGIMLSIISNIASKLNAFHC